MNDPYVVLGVGRDATDQQIKDAYRELAKKYHPDNYADNPLSDLAEDKMKEINEAYDAIMNERRGGGQSRSSYHSSSNPIFKEIRNLINYDRLEEAQARLDDVPIENRTAEWYFLNGSVQYKRGWFDNAYTNFSTACRMDPNNAEYRSALNQIQRKRNGYNPYNQPTGGNVGGCDGCDLCTGLCIADSCCECMGGDCIGCC